MDAEAKTAIRMATTILVILELDDKKRNFVFSFCYL